MEQTPCSGSPAARQPNPCRSASPPLQCTALLEAPSARDVPAKLGQLEPTRPEKWDLWLSHLIEARAIMHPECLKPSRHWRRLPVFWQALLRKAFAAKSKPCASLASQFGILASQTPHRPLNPTRTPKSRQNGKTMAQNL